jgi:predicted HicB family RNase H-like nuclease
MALTPARSVRIPEALWKKAKAKAKAQHTTVTAIIVKALYDWVNE